MITEEISQWSWIGIGANLGDPLATCIAAVSNLERSGLLRVRRISRFYSTAPLGGSDQPRYVNGVLGGEPLTTAPELLAGLLRIEREFGRIRDPLDRNAPRTLDLDLLFHSDLVISTPELTLPHPRLHLRCFVLQPLFTLAPTLTHPIFGKTVDTMLKEVDDCAGVIPIEPE